MIPQCEQIEVKIAAFIEETADMTTRIEVEAHLSVCHHCQAFVREQRTIRHQLRLLARKNLSHPPSRQIWERASASWNAQDARQHRANRVPWALVVACLLLMMLGTVWANLKPNHDFPLAAILKDYSNLKNRPVAPMMPTSDPDHAALWLRNQLGAELPPINLSLSEGDLVGADILQMPTGRIGRLLYRMPAGKIVAVYMVPGLTHFAQSHRQIVEAHDFQTVSTEEIGMFGWEIDGIGYSLLVPQSMYNGRMLAVNAKEVSAQPVGPNR